MVQQTISKMVESLGHRMKVVATILAVLIGLALVFVAVRFANETIAPLFLNSRIERLGDRTTEENRMNASVKIVNGIRGPGPTAS